MVASADGTYVMRDPKPNAQKVVTDFVQLTSVQFGYLPHQSLC